MMRAGLICGWILFVHIASFASTAATEPLAVGDRLDSFSLQDQHGVVHTVDGATRVILFSRDMDGGKVLKEALSEAPEGFLEDRASVYLADISGMPKLVARLFALPSMRKRPYAVLLDRDGSTTKRLPDLEGHATLIFCQDLEITRVEHVETSNAVRQALSALPSPTQD